MASCHTPVASGYYIYPSTERIRRLRRNILELVLSEYPPDRLHPEPGMIPTEFQRVVAAHGSPAVRYPHSVTNHETDRSHPYIWSDLAECIKCYRCVRACDELQAEHVLGIHGRGRESRIIKGYDQSFREIPVCVMRSLCADMPDKRTVRQVLHKNAEGRQHCANHMHILRCGL